MHDFDRDHCDCGNDIDCDLCGTCWSCCEPDNTHDRNE